jgi:hypothetical protein
MPDDDITPPEPDTADDARDARVAALLAVDPLDDVTRRRLVSTAIRSTGTARHARRLIGAAAAVVVLIVGAGVVVAVGNGDDSTTSSAARDKAASLAPQADASRNFAVESDARGVGDFGDLAVAANVDRLRRAFDSASVGAGSKSGAAAASAPTAEGGSGNDLSTAESSDSLVARLRALSCAATGLPPGTVVAVASGTLGGKPVIVVDLVSSSGSHSFHAIAVDTCAVTPLS